MKTIREMIEVMEAAERGAKIENICRQIKSWNRNAFPQWNWRDFDYRVAPKRMVQKYGWMLVNRDGPASYVFSEKGLLSTKDGGQLVSVTWEQEE